MNKKLWTVMMFMAGDNDLSNAAIRDLKRAKIIGSTDAVDVIAQNDPATNDRTARYHLRPGGDLGDDVVELIPETDTGDASTLIAFGRWVRKNFSAEREMLVIWGHGSGVEGLASDSCPKTVLTVPELGRAVAAIATRSPLAILGLDACVMSSLEIPYELRNSVPLLVASQESVPELSWPYDEMIKYLDDDPRGPLEDVARMMVDVTAANADPVHRLTMAAIRVYEVRGVATAVTNLANALVSVVKDCFDTIQLAHYAAQTFNRLGSVDLVNFCEELLKRNMPADVKRAAEVVIKSVDRMIIVSRYVNPGVDRSHGISIFLPKACVPLSYRKLAFARKTTWLAFLDAYLKCSAERTPLEAA